MRYSCGSAGSALSGAKDHPATGTCARIRPAAQRGGSQLSRGPTTTYRNEVPACYTATPVESIIVIPHMGLDALDMLFRLEKSFGVKFEKGFWDRMPRGEVVEPARWWSCDRFVTRSSTSKWRYERRVPVVTAGDVHAAVCAALTEKGMAVPSDSWPRVRAVLSGVTGHAVEEIIAQSRLFDDLGFA